MSIPRQPGDNQPISPAPPIAEATNSEAASKLIVGACYTGIITKSNSDGTYNVQVNEPHVSVNNARRVSPVIGGLLGFNVRSKLIAGTNVNLTFGKPSYIFGIVNPPNIADVIQSTTRSMVWGDSQNTTEVIDDIPDDLLEGEFEISNLHGVAAQFLTHLMRMTAGDRAAIEVHLLNDMVRLISSQFRHISGIGEELIFDHGRPTLERTWSSYRHELMGKMKEGEEFAQLDGDYIDRDPLLTAEAITAAGRYRLLEFIGFAGDMIHSFVADPATAVAELLSDSIGGAGKSWIHRNSDGSVLVQSVADIRLERVCRIPVPARKASHEDPEISTQRDYAKLNEAFLQLPDFGSISKKSAYKLTYHLRSYSRWLSRMHAFARMLQLESEYVLQSEADAPKPSWTNAEADKDKVGAGVEYFDSYACICIMRDGSIVLHDGYGSSVAMTNGNIQISASRHLDIEAAGDIRMVSGGSVFIKARRNIELSAAVGGIVLHCYAFARMLCEKGSVWLRSLADLTEDPAAKQDGPKPEVASIAGVKYGVVLESAAAGTALRTSGQTLISGEGPLGSEPDSRDSTATDIIFSTKGNVRSQSVNLLLKASKSLVVNGGEVIAMNSTALYGQLGEVDLAGGLNFKNGKLSVRELAAPTISGNNILGKKLPPWSDPNDVSAAPTPKHFNHIQALPEGTVVELVQGISESGKDALKYATGAMAGGTFAPVLNSSQGPVWTFLGKTEYYWDGREESAGALAETLTQQYLRLDSTDGDAWQGNGYESWDWSATISGTRVETSNGFGYQANVYQSSTGDNLRVPLSYDPTDPEAFSTAIDWVPTSTYNFRYLKR
jgi:hypothetical protein